MGKIFYIEGIHEKAISYDFLLNDIVQTKKYSRICYEKEYYQIFKHIVLSIILDEEIILLDSDFSDSEINKLLGETYKKENQERDISIEKDINHADFIFKIRNGKNWKISIFTSGTTGLPKKITHTIDSITKSIKIAEKNALNIWGFAYNPTHMAGLQVFFQAFLNKNAMIRLFGKKKEEVLDLIHKYSITNISATPTFYKMLLPSELKLNSVSKITFGGEKLPDKLQEKLNDIFPKASFLNVYASTEAGSLFAAKKDVFEIRNKELTDKIRIENNQLFVHCSLMGKSETLHLNNDWYNTNDLVEIVSANPLKFKFLSRQNEMINVGGYKVNPYEVEEVINEISGVKEALVFSRPNSVLGNIICCQIVLSEGSDLELSHIKKHMGQKLQNFKIPRVIKLVDKIEKTRSGKIRR